MCGLGDQGQLGIGKKCKEGTPILCMPSKQVIYAACGIVHTCILTNQNELYSFGGNNFGQLGIGHKKAMYSPTLAKINTKSNIVKIACGNFTAAINKDGELFVWGTGSFGEHLLPKKIELTEKCADISVGGCFCEILSITGNIYSLGSNSCGELGLGDYKARTTPAIVKKIENKSVSVVSCGNDFTIAIGKIKEQSTQKDLNESQSIITFTANRQNDIFPKLSISRNISIQSNPILNHNSNEFKIITNKTACFGSPGTFKQNSSVQSERQVKMSGRLKPNSPTHKMEMKSIALDCFHNEEEVKLLNLLTEQRNCLEKAYEEEKTKSDGYQKELVQLQQVINENNQKLVNIINQRDQAQQLNAHYKMQVESKNNEVQNISMSNAESMESMTVEAKQCKKAVKELESELQSIIQQKQAKDNELEKTKTQNNILNAKIEELNKFIQYKDKDIIAKEKEMLTYKEESERMRIEHKTATKAMQDDILKNKEEQMQHRASTDKELKECITEIEQLRKANSMLKETTFQLKAKNKEYKLSTD